MGIIADSLSRFHFHKWIFSNCLQVRGSSLLLTKHGIYFYIFVKKKIKNPLDVRGSFLLLLASCLPDYPGVNLILSQIPVRHSFCSEIHSADIINPVVFSLLLEFSSPNQVTNFPVAHLRDFSLFSDLFNSV